MSDVTLDELMKTPHTCKVFNKREREYLNFDYEYTKSDEIIAELEDNDVDLTQYQTEENKIKEIKHEEDWGKFRDEHLSSCQDPYCVISNKYQKQKQGGI